MRPHCRIAPGARPGGGLGDTLSRSKTSRNQGVVRDPLEDSSKSRIRLETSFKIHVFLTLCPFGHPDHPKQETSLQKFKKKTLKSQSHVDPPKKEPQKRRKLHNMHSTQWKKRDSGPCFIHERKIIEKIPQKHQQYRRPDSLSTAAEVPKHVRQKNAGIPPCISYFLLSRTQAEHTGLHPNCVFFEGETRGRIL